MKESYREFCSNRFSYKNSYYIPKKFTNDLRHFGTKKENDLCLSPVEILFLYYKYLGGDISISLLPLKVRIYFFLKNQNYNIIESNDKSELLIFRKTNNFNRKKDDPIGTLEIYSKDKVFDSNQLKNTEIISVYGDKMFCFLKLSRIDLSVINKNKKEMKLQKP